MAPPRVTNQLIGPGCRERFLRMDNPSAIALRSLGVQLAGVSDLAKPYLIERESPRIHVALYTISGAGWCDIEGCPARLVAGDLLTIPAGTSTAYGIAERRWRILWFHFHPSSGLGLALRDRPAGVRPAAFLPRLEAAMEGFLAEAHGDGGGDRAAELGAELIACYLERELADLDPRSAAARRRLQELWDAVDRDLRHPWSVAALATHLHESPINLYRLCARHFGVKPMAMVTRMRMERARQLLRQTDEPLKRIADWIGYRNEFAFSTAFKRVTGKSPRDFRERGRETSKEQAPPKK
jgi:AraC-like DNA-binding protein